MSSPDAMVPGRGDLEAGDRGGIRRELRRDRHRTARLAAVRPYRLVSAAVELVVAAAFVVGVYELVVAGGTTLWPTATDDWILPMWIAAATVSGLGLGPVRSLVRKLLARLWPSGAADPYAALASFVAGASAAEPAEEALRRLAQLAVTGTGARRATVWLAQPDGTQRLGARWPMHPDSPDDKSLPSEPVGDYTVPVIDSGEQLGLLTLTAPTRRDLMPRDLRLAENIADAAGLLLRQAELTAQLADEVQRQTEQAAELDRSRRRVLAARDAAREQLGGQIRARVGEPLMQCSTMVSALLDEDAARQGETGPRSLAEMTELIDTAIVDFRKIVHGVYPAALTDHGLAAALDNLLTQLPRRTAYSAQGLPRLSARIEAGVYFCVAALFGVLPDAPEDQPLELKVELVDDVLVTVLLDSAQRTGTQGDQPPEASAVRNLLQDRIDAMEGELRISQDPDGMRCELRVPVPAVEAVAT